MASRTGNIMLLASRQLLWTICRRKAPTVLTPPVQRCLLPTRVIYPTPSVCIHTSQRLHQDDTRVEPAGAGHSAEQPPSSGETASEGSAADIALQKLADLGLGKTYIPPTSTDSLVFNGVPYDKLHIIHIKASYNNTIISITDHKGGVLQNVSAGTEGFKNARQGTSVAGQTVGSAAAKAAISRGIKNVRVLIKGIGKGRQTAVKGLQVGGLEIVSITDRTGIPNNGDRPRKARRL